MAKGVAPPGGGRRLGIGQLGQQGADFVKIGQGENAGDHHRLRAGAAVAEGLLGVGRGEVFRKSQPDAPGREESGQQSRVAADAGGREGDAVVAMGGKQRDRGEDVADAPAQVGFPEQQAEGIVVVVDMVKGKEVGVGLLVAAIGARFADAPDVEAIDADAVLEGAVF